MAVERLRHRTGPIPVIDLFAGPGGLGEGFSSVRHENGEYAYEVRLSIEKDPFAHRTLRLRSFCRQFLPDRPPSDYYRMLRQEITETELFARHPEEAAAAERDAVLGTLGGSDLPAELLNARIRAALGGAKMWVLIGGPPCQAYSTAGRSRNKGIAGYSLEQDDRHRLYQEYLRIVADHWPPVFVMENVKGLLSTTVKDRLLFERIYDDLSQPARALGRSGGRRYRILSFEAGTPGSHFDSGDPRRFIVYAERHGVPQCRHRVILLGVRSDLGDCSPSPLPRSGPVPVRSVLEGLPALRSGLSPSRRGYSGHIDSPDTWCMILRDALKRSWIDLNSRVERREEVRATIVKTLENLRPPSADRGAEFVPGEVTIAHEPKWFLDHRIGGACNHSTRQHMAKDLHRYLFVACYAQVHGVSPRLWHFHGTLLPKHDSVRDALKGGYFNDRFRVQPFERPATTITSHIHKDGHYYVHPDPSQCRSLTVREAARLQTFPDNYFFAGPRTEQYIQVGNAVPPLLAKQIAEQTLDMLIRAGTIR